MVPPCVNWSRLDISCAIRNAIKVGGSQIPSMSSMNNPSQICPSRIRLHQILGKSVCENFKTKQRRAATPDELMIFPDTHEAIIEQDTWDIAQKLRSKKKPKAANGTYSHRLSGLVYCADCGARMGYTSPEAKHSGIIYDSDSAFQCGSYRNIGRECVSHFIKTSVLEAAVLQSIQTVSKYALENEEEFISQLKALWNEQKQRHIGSGQQELEEAGKRCRNWTA